MKSLKTLGAVALLSTSMLGAATSFAASSEYKAEPGTAETPVKAKFKLPTDGGENPEPSNPTNPDNPDNPEGNKPLDPKGPFGIAYIPAALETDQFDNEGVQLNESGAQDFAFTNKDVRVGVKDKTRTQGGWKLQARLSWDGKQLPGSTILATTDKVQINKGEGQYEDTSNVTSQPNITIGNSDSDIMVGQDLSGEEVYNSTFDVKLQDAKLHLEDAGKVKADTYQGKITWTLAATEV